MDKRRRRDTIREIVSTGRLSSQAQLVKELAARGIEADQSTVSRDLRDMGLVRLPGPDGATVYGFPGEQVQSGGEADLARALKEFATAFEASGNLLVVRTAPGNAHALAAVIDRTRMEEVAGTVAGDDTIIVVVREGYGSKRLAGRLDRLSR
jgi:transcriptional regulator of arginine metabolism